MGPFPPSALPEPKSHLYKILVHLLHPQPPRNHQKPVTTEDTAYVSLGSWGRHEVR